LDVAHELRLGDPGVGYQRDAIELAGFGDVLLSGREREERDARPPGLSALPKRAIADQHPLWRPWTRTAVVSPTARCPSWARGLYSAAEMINHTADLVSDFAGIVHDNERRWRVFRARTEELAATFETKLTSHDKEPSDGSGTRLATRTGNSDGQTLVMSSGKPDAWR
jgi:hypothetical protein